MTETCRSIIHLDNIGCCWLCILFYLSLKLILGYGQLNSTTVLDLMHQACINMQHLGAGHICFRSDSSFREIAAILYSRSITTDILE